MENNGIIVAADEPSSSQQSEQEQIVLKTNLTINEDGSNNTMAAEVVTEESKANVNAEANMAPETPSNLMSDHERVIRIKKLKAKLINEEHRLVLMKKIRQSQTRPVNQQQQQQQQQLNNQQQAASAQRKLHHQQQQQQQLLLQQQQQQQQANNGQLNATSNSNNLLHSKKLRPSHSILSPGLSSLSPALIQQFGLKNQLLLNAASDSSRSASSSKAATPIQAPAHAHQRPKSNTQWNQPVQQNHQPPPPPPAGIAPAHIGNISRQPITTPPNVVAMMNNLTAGRQHQSQQSQSHQQLNNHQQQSQASLYNKSQVAQMLLQKRSAAKLAIQKQVEQTLMQLPEKRVQSGIIFIPNANNIEFLYYTGLETCVDYLTNTKSPLDTKPLDKPLECINCGTDFTTTWSWKRSNPVCNNCVSSHIKKSIRNSQAGRIKSVLAEVTKQEQEMEQKIMTEAASIVAQPTTPVISTHQRNSLLQQHTSNHGSAHSASRTPTTSSGARNSLLQQPSNRTPSRSTPHLQATDRSRANSSGRASARSSATKSNGSNVNQNHHNNQTMQQNMNNQNILANNALANMNLGNPFAALGSLQPAALASLLQMNPQLSSLASLMSANAAPVVQPNNTNQIAQVAALLMNQMNMNMWNKR